MPRINDLPSFIVQGNPKTMQYDIIQTKDWKCVGQVSFSVPDGLKMATEHALHLAFSKAEF
jgi:hypothetical protein